MRKALDTKALRDLKRLRGQAVATALLVACGVSLLTSSWSAFRSLRAARDQAYASLAMADVFCDLKRAPLSLLPGIARIEGVGRVDARLVFEGLVGLPRPGAPIELGPPASARLISLPAQDASGGGLNLTWLRRGKLPRDTGDPETAEVLVHEGFAHANSLEPGDALWVQAQGKRLQAVVTGIAISPDTVYALSPAAPLPDDRGFAILWLPRRTLERMTGMAAAFNQLSVTLARPSAGAGGLDSAPALARLRSALDSRLAAYGSRGSYARAKLPSARFVDDEIAQQRASAFLMPSVFLSIAAFLVHLIAQRLIELQRPQLGALKALGYRDGEISSHYLKIVAAMMALGAVPGIGLGALFGKLMARSYENFFRFPKLEFQLSAEAVVLGLLGGLLPGLLGAATSVRAAARLAPAEALRPRAPLTFGRGTRWLDSWIHKLPVRGRMLARNLLSRPMRLGLSIAGVAAATGVVIASLSWSDIIDFLLTTQFERVQREDTSLVLLNPVTLAGLRELQARPGVLALEAYRVLPARLHFGHREEDIAVTGWPENTRLRKRLDSRLREIPLPPEGLLLGRAFQKRWHLVPGDTVELEPLEGKARRIPLRVAGFTDELMGLTAAMEGAGLARALGEQQSFNSVTLKTDSRLRAELLGGLRGSPLIVSIQSKSALTRGFQDSMGGLIRVTTTILVLFALALASGVLYNSLRVAFSERAWEIASLRVLGFSAGEAFTLLLAEAAAETLLGILPGFLFGYGLTRLILLGVSSETFSFPVVIEPSSYAWAALAVLLAFVAGAWAVHGLIVRASLTESLKARE